MLESSHGTFRSAHSSSDLIPNLQSNLKSEDKLKNSKKIYPLLTTPHLVSRFPICEEDDDSEIRNEPPG